MPRPLPEPERRFALEVVGGRAPAEAFLVAFEYARSWPRRELEHAAKELADAHRIKREMNLLRQPAMLKAIETLNITEENLLQKLEDAYWKAMGEEKQASAAIAAAMGQAKITGHLVEDRKNGKTPLDELPAAKLKEAIEAIRGINDRSKVVSEALDGF
jgi:uncharacterized protein YfeS